MQKSAQSVIPAKAGIQSLQQVTISWIHGSSPRMTLSDSLEGRNDMSDRDYSYLSEYHFPI
ncbi:MAG: hypothetical protein P9L92_12670 [Candidatus Electryonea clarkiae]|nr:hypothetical protein [Candidatus Electryonea clarkiae]MDP8285033.1 hypothetical protein [Candidatus Electryonea clarkiae]